MFAFVVDASNGYLTHRQSQAAADASALAGAQDLPNTTNASATVATFAGKNFSSGVVTQIYSSTYIANDTVTTTATASRGTFFAKVVGINSIEAKATATAVHGSYQGWSQNIAPWATDRATAQFGQIITFKVAPGDQASSGNFGGVDLPIVSLGCSIGQGGSVYYDLIRNIEKSCLVKKGDQLPPEPGDKANTGKALQDRGAIKPFDPWSIIRTLPDGSYGLTTYTHPNVIVIPIIDAFNNGNSTPFTVVGMAWFIITDYTAKTVTGMFLRAGAPPGAKCPTASDPDAPCPVGAYDPDGFGTVVFKS
jgi:hypothetical protein